MKISILGTGNVGQTFAEKFSSLGYQVAMGTRDVAGTLARVSKDNYGSLPFADWHSKNATVALYTFAEAVKFADIVLIALQGAVTIDVLKAIPAQDFDNKIIIDITNPLDFSKGFPPSLLEGLNNTNSLGEEIQKILPNAKVVKTLNTMWSGIMINPAMISNGNHANFISGNDDAAKTTVKEILASFGWANDNTLDLGDITNARGTEAYLLLWTRVYSATKNGAFNIQFQK